MSSVASSAAPSASGAGCNSADFTVFPTADAACAVGSIQGVPSNTSSVLSGCCKSAPVEQFNGDCGYYCLSVEQTIAELQGCFMENGVTPSDIMCNLNNTATATGKPSSRPSATSSGSRGSGTANAGADQPGSAAPQAVSKHGLGILGMIVMSALAGAVL